MKVRHMDTYHSRSRQTGEVAVLELFRDRPWNQIPGRSLSLGQVGHDGGLADFTLQTHLNIIFITIELNIEITLLGTLISLIVF